MSRKLLVLVAAVAVALGGFCVWRATSALKPARLSSQVGGAKVARAGEATDPGSGAPHSGASGADAQAGRGQAAIDRAADAGKYLFIYFYDGENSHTQVKRDVLDAAIRDVADRADLVDIDISDASERALVDRFQASRAPMPLVLALAPTGAVTAAFPTEFTEEQLLGAFVSPATETCLAALQRGHLVLVCVQNASTRSNDEAMQGATDFAADPRFSGSADIVTVDPGSEAEAVLLGKLDVDPKTPDAVTVLMTPPGNAVAKFTGATDKDELIKKLEASRAPSGCAPGSSPGCCPKN